MHPSDVFTNRIPYRPYCSNDLSTGLKVRSAKQALDCLHIQPNPPLQITWLVFDLDFEGAALAWEKRNVAPPSIIAINPENAHAHLFYGLITPVTVSDAGRHAPIRYAAALQAAYAAALQADLGYAGLIAKNPFHPGWRVIWVNHLYDLNELAEWLTIPKRLPARDPIGLGRNCLLFDEIRAWAYRWVREYKHNDATPGTWQSAVIGQAEQMNKFKTPLAYTEVKAIGRSVARWTWREFSDAAFSAIQSARGKLGGRPRTTTEHGQPWDALNISRATYYRRSQSGLLLPG